jgi:hypothetical protein
VAKSESWNGSKSTLWFCRVVCGIFARKSFAHIQLRSLQIQQKPWPPFGLLFSRFKMKMVLGETPEGSGICQNGGYANWRDVFVLWICYLGQNFPVLIILLKLYS